MRIDLLDMGKTKYGDCVLIRRGNRSILIDGGHSGDAARILAQLQQLLGHEPPFAVNLLVVTHCHDDHIGCLPKLIQSGDLTAKVALVADEKLGWGRGADGVGPTDALDLSPAQRVLIAALHEEDHSDLPQAELEQFLQDAATLEQRYGDMLARLEEQGTKVVRFGGAATDAVQALEPKFASFGLQVLGPAGDQLALCAHAIAQGTDAIVDAVRRQDLAADADASRLVRAYRTLARGPYAERTADAAGEADQVGVGAAKNGQSIVLRVAADGWSALLAGDMQFAAAEVPGLAPLMTALRQKVAAAGPYDFIKLPHHASYNGVDASLLDEWAGTKLFGHSGGSNDPSHPDEDVLELLQSRQDQLIFARTDRNGMVSLVNKQGKVKLLPSPAAFNDFSVNEPPDVEMPAELPEEMARTTRSVTVGTGDDMVEVTARVPHRATRVTLSIQVEPGAGEPRVVVTPGEAVEAGVRGRPALEPAVSRDVPRLQLGGGRQMPELLFVTCRPRLENNIGRLEAAGVFDALAAAPSVQVVDLPTSVETPAEAALIVRHRLAAGKYVGVVLLGGYDVVPAERLDVLDPATRQALETSRQIESDDDNFIVWSDELYGDRDGAPGPELPVSRIPDGRRWEVVYGALQAPQFKLGARFGVRNVYRPFANEIFGQLPGDGGRLEVSERFSPQDVLPGVAAGAVYYMLHGSMRDGTRFWGETAGGSTCEAVAIENVPDRAAGSVVFTGCCWGALTCAPPAVWARPDIRLRPRGPEASLAVAYLRAGALAFVGCTGSHYSPSQAPYDYYGKPMHAAFWAAIGAGKAPAEALYWAKGEYVRHMPHGRRDTLSQAIEVKILREYTCLGLGW